MLWWRQNELTRGNFNVWPKSRMSNACTDGLDPDQRRPSRRRALRADARFHVNGVADIWARRRRRTLLAPDSDHPWQRQISEASLDVPYEARGECRNGSRARCCRRSPPSGSRRAAFPICSRRNAWPTEFRSNADHRQRHHVHPHALRPCGGAEPDDGQ